MNSASGVGFFFVMVLITAPLTVRRFYDVYTSDEPIERDPIVDIMLDQAMKLIVP